MEYGVVVEGYDAGGGVEMEGGDDEVGEADVGGGLGEEGEGGDEGSGVVVGLVVEDYAGFVGRGGEGLLGGEGRGRHGPMGLVMVLGGRVISVRAAFCGGWGVG